MGIHEVDEEVSEDKHVRVGDDGVEAYWIKDRSHPQNIHSIVGTMKKGMKIGPNRTAIAAAT